jgi:hypothetical protein
MNVTKYSWEITMHVKISRRFDNVGVKNRLELRDGSTMEKRKVLIGVGVE